MTPADTAAAVLAAGTIRAVAMALIFAAGIALGRAAVAIREMREERDDGR